MPPPAVSLKDAAKPLATVALVNPGFESTPDARGGAPEGWDWVQHAGPPSYAFTIDDRVRHAGRHSLRIDNTGPEPYGMLYQGIDATAWRGRTLRLSAWLRTEGALGNHFGRGAGLTLFAMRGGYPVTHAQMRNNAVHGSVDWTRYEITLKIPPQAARIELGVSLYGPGKAWIDDVALDVVEDAGA